MGLFRKTFLIPLILLMLPGCSHYKWGNPGLNALPFQTLYVKPVINKTFVPEAQALLSQQLIRCLQQSGICITECEENADATLIVVMSNYVLTPITTQRKDTTLASSFHVLLETKCTLINNLTCEPCFTNQIVSASLYAEATDSVQQVMYQDMPILTAKVADKVRNLITGAW